jgi:hypothetical protein
MKEIRSDDNQNCYHNQGPGKRNLKRKLQGCVIETIIAISVIEIYRNQKMSNNNCNQEFSVTCNQNCNKIL